MKKIVTLIQFSLIGLCISAQTVNLNSKGLTINDILVTESWFLIDLKAALGEPTRFDKKVRVHNYDPLGLLIVEGIYRKKPDGKVKEIQIHFGLSEVSEYKPGAFFSGTMRVNQTVIDGNTGSDELLPLLADFQKRPSAIPHNYRYQNDFFYIYVLFNEDESELLKMSIGPRE